MNDKLNEVIKCDNKFCSCRDESGYCKLSKCVNPSYKFKLRQIQKQQDQNKIKE